MKIKLKDVAQKAKVSTATVSRVLNNHPVKETTREKVEDAIASLDYRPNLLARGLIKGTSNRIGVIVPNMENPYFSSVINAMEIHMRKTGYLCNFSSAIHRDHDERDIINRYLDSGIDGLIMVDVSRRGENSGLYMELNKTIPVIFINGNPDRNDSNQVMVDQKRGMAIAMDYLFSLNHRKIAFLRGSLESLSFANKEKVFINKMRSIGIPQENLTILELLDSDCFTAIEKTEELVLPILDSLHKPTALFASNELMAMGVIKATRKLALSIPKDLSLVAHDNTYLSRIATPALTTIDMNPPHLGYEAAEMMLQLLKQKNPPPRKLIFNPELMIRDSCQSVC